MIVMHTALLALMLLQSSPSGEPANGAVGERLDYVVSQLVKSGYTQQDAEALFQDKRLEVLPPVKVQPRQIDWDAVIASLVAPASVLRGAAFLAQYKDVLNQAETKYAVDP